MDRTSEFLNAVRIFRDTEQRKAVPPVLRQPKDVVDKRVKSGAAEVASSLRMTARLVAQLRVLVSGRSLYNDRAQQINENTAVIKRNLDHQSAQLAALVKLVAARGGTPGGRAHWMQVSEVLKLRLMACTKGLQDALTVRAKNMKRMEAHKSRFNRSNWEPLVQIDRPMFAPQSRKRAARPPVAAAPPRPSSSSSSQNGHASTPGRHSGNADTWANAGTGGGYGGNSAPQMAPQRNRRQGNGTNGANQVVERRQLPQSQAPFASGPSGLRHRAGGVDTNGGGGNAFYMTPGNLNAQAHMARQQRARNKRLEAEQVESSIVELGHMFTQMNHLVIEQAAQAKEIEENMILAEAEVQKGNTELLKWLQDVSRHRALIIKVFAILVVFILLFAWMNRR